MVTDDLVLVLPTLLLPLPPPPPKEEEEEGEEGAPEPSYELALVDSSSDAVLGSVALTPTGAENMFAAARPVKGLHIPTLSVRVLGEGGVPVFSSPPLSELADALSAARGEASQAKADGSPNADELKAAAAELATVSPVGGLAGTLTDMLLPPTGDGDASAQLSCDWRLQRALPTVGEQLPGDIIKISTSEMRHAAYRSSPAQLYSAEQRFRPRPLAMRYSAPKDIIEFETRLNSWRAELTDNLKVDPAAWPPYAAAAALEVNTIPSAAPRSAARGGICEFPPQEWSEKWRPPYVPHHMRGDARTLAAKQEYIDNCEEYRMTFHRQKISVELSELQKELTQGRIGYKAAHQGLAMVRRMRAFLDELREVRAEGKANVIKERNLRQADAATLDSLLKLLRRIKLPFELLVPDLEYEGEKAVLGKMIERELERRKKAEAAAAAAAASKPAEAEIIRVPGRKEPPFVKESGGALPRTRPMSVGWGRAGVLSFRGSLAPKPEKVAIWAKPEAA